MSQGKIFITGGAGYIGSHTVKVLLEQGYKDLIIFDNLEQGHRDAVLGGKFVEGDLRNKEALEKVFSENKIDAVIHFAAYTCVPESVLEPAKYFENNLIGGFNLLESMRRHSVKKIVFSSSSSVYGEAQTELINEQHPKNPTNPYGYTKLAFEEMLMLYYRVYGFFSISFRYFCAAGVDPSSQLGERHDPETHLIPRTILAALGKVPPLKIFGTDYPTKDGTGVRDFIHVNDLASGHIVGLKLLLSSKESICRAYNLGIGKGYSVREVINAVSQIARKIVPTEEAERRPGDPAILIADSSLVKKELGWQPKFIELEKIVETAFNFFKKI